jgi:hypothetical protein
MPSTSKLKVYRLPIGFHDAYVAAPSQKAAIEAWGSDKDVFTRKLAELVADPELTPEPLASPGKVIKRLRGTAAEQVAALGKDEAAPKRTRPAPKPKPRPRREKLEEAEQALEEAETRHEAEREEIAKREAELARERKALEKKQREERERLEARRDKAEAAYEESMRRWRES